MLTRGRAAIVAGLMVTACATPVPPVTPPPVVATKAPPPPEMPRGGYLGLEVPAKRVDGRYITPNIDMTPAAAVWHLRGALNVAALVCDTGNGPVVTAYNSWIRSRGPVLDGYVKQYLREWEQTGWADWQAAYDNQQTRLYNFYSQQPMRDRFCVVARGEAAAIGAVADPALPDHARAALARMDAVFIDFFRAYERWEEYYYANTPKAVAPQVVSTVRGPVVRAAPAHALTPPLPPGTGDEAMVTPAPTPEPEPAPTEVPAPPSAAAPATQPAPQTAPRIEVAPGVLEG
jgi:hypothetical protein